MLLDRHQRKRDLFYSLWFSLGFGHQQVSSENKTSSSKWRKKKNASLAKSGLKLRKGFEKGITRSLHTKPALNERNFSFYRTVCNGKNAMFADKHMAKSYYFLQLSIKQLYQGKRVPRGTHKPVSRWVKTHSWLRF